MVAKSSERELATPKEDAVIGPVRRKVRSADGALRARIGWSAYWEENGAVYLSGCMDLR